ncbi:MAG: sulfur carrier protein ThiS [Candidatus Thiodiazotropha sp.]|nr:sulfur carrier protein ThiS [Candidatus Thiodiazotropha sp.]MCU7801952.1 sulfur carrier protein ThiS [Candidatus Thiodiazotropha sp. (ex Lucinoma borealis)]MCU7838898.1 sulfur carrier protein ThiS [Candidatus Thiodiazotropha sp. (ex Troendleina suluensis)]MCU7883745.1 sulfur carrier protein ThiS [Candidatus Thiodiazotropha sp. (ex Lucinoma annulata)]MCU7945654.1 sulfur carrier protein ThiS [Candidatus Thiodiazotropha sp. (ex Cardiolucina cf. quadrata)]
MQIYLNGVEKQIPDQLDMASFIASLNLTGQRIAVEVNEELVPRSTFNDHQLQEQDHVEIIQAVGGG